MDVTFNIAGQMENKYSCYSKWIFMPGRVRTCFSFDSHAVTSLICFVSWLKGEVDWNEGSPRDFKVWWYIELCIDKHTLPSDNILYYLADPPSTCSQESK